MPVLCHWYKKTTKVWKYLCIFHLTIFHFKTRIYNIKETWHFDGFVSSLSKDKKLTWLVVIFIENESAKSPCKFKLENGQITIEIKSFAWMESAWVFRVGLLSLIINISHIKQSNFPLHFFFYKYYHKSCKILLFENDDMKPSKLQVSFKSLIYTT